MIHEIFIKKYITQAPISIEGNTIKFDQEQAQEMVANIPQIFDLRPSADLRQLQEKILQEFQTSVVHLKDPETESPSCSPDMQKHFMMVSLDHMPFFYYPKECLETRGKWEALKRAVEFSGAKVTVQNANDRKNPQYFSCRDTYTMVNNIAYLSDPKSPGAQILKMAESMFPAISQRIDDSTRLQAFFSQRDQISQILGNTWFDGGNVIVHPRSRTVFWGMESYKGNMGIHLDGAHILQKTLNETQGQDWTVLPVLLSQMNKDPVLRMEDMVSQKQTPFYHLDMGMSEPLENGEVFIYPDMTYPYIFQKISDIVGQENILSITYEEGEKRSANMISNGMSIIMSSPSDRLKNLLHERGYQIISAQDFGVDRLGFTDADPHCLTNIIHQPTVP